MGKKCPKKVLNYNFYENVKDRNLKFDIAAGFKAKFTHSTI